jgi:hypothetical protein
MKGLGVLAAGVLLIGAMYFYISKSMAKDVVTLPVGYGKPADTVEMHIAVSMFLPKKDPPKLKHNIVQWDEWVADHFQLHDADGQRVQLSRTGFSNILSDRQSGGTPEFWLKSMLKPGAKYTITFTPVMPEPTYQQTFTAPTAEVDADWFTFETD